MVFFRALVSFMRSLVVTFFFFFLGLFGPLLSVTAESNQALTSEKTNLDSSEVVIAAPGLENRELVAPLAEMMEHLSPSEDGWDSESFSEAATAQLYQLKSLLRARDSKHSDFSNLTTDDFQCSVLRPNSELLVSEEGSEFRVRRWKGDSLSVNSLSLFEVSQQFNAVFVASVPEQLATKLYKIQSSKAGEVITNVLLEASGAVEFGGEVGRHQINAEWRCHWQKTDAEPLLNKIELLSYEEVTRKHGKGESLFSDQTKFAFGKNPSFTTHLLHSTDYWRARFPQMLGLDVVANVGFVLADLNGDGLEDLYLCQQGGLPNLLFLRKDDGTFVDASAESGADWMDFSPSALALDLDQDGDRDLIVAMQFELLMMRNDGSARFELAATVPLISQTFSINAADYDLDGDLDLFTCGYNPSREELKESGALGSPLPFHDANNGGRNTLLQNVGPFQFQDVSVESGFRNHTRFSFAAAWEDYDLDGDPDLYVANDYGRNNLYRNDEGKFVDVAGELGVEDMSAGISVSWEDFNRDGNVDLYVSNMFSSAGNRVTFQKKFQSGDAGDTLGAYQRFARGNSLFQGSSEKGVFKDASLTSGATMARWCWGSRFADLDNDGWQDILAANGFISTPDTGDL